MAKTTEVQHRLNARKYVDDTNRMNAKMKEGRKTALSSVKENIVQQTIHKIEDEIAQKGRRVPLQTFAGFKRPWKSA